MTTKIKTNKYMDLGTALAHVHSLATAGASVTADNLDADGKTQSSVALDVVEDFIVNNFELDTAELDEDKKYSTDDTEELFEALFEAMEQHGNVEGTEAQLNDATTFLRTALDCMTMSERKVFLNRFEVKSFIRQELGLDSYGQI